MFHSVLCSVNSGYYVIHHKSLSDIQTRICYLDNESVQSPVRPIAIINPCSPTAIHGLQALLPPYSMPRNGRWQRRLTQIFTACSARGAKSQDSPQKALLFLFLPLDFIPLATHLVLTYSRSKHSRLLKRS